MGWESLGWQAWITLGTILGVLGLLAFTRYNPDMILLAALTFLLLTGVMTPKEAFMGFSNEGVITVGVLYVIAAGLRETGAVGMLVQRLLGHPRSVIEAQARVMLPVTFASAWMNNTPLVAMLLPVVREWAKKYQFPASQLLIPLSYAAILGGICTLIGTSTNLIVNGLMVSAGLKPLGFFDITWVGLPCALAGIFYLLLFGRWLLPNRQPVTAQFENPREYTAEMLVEPNGPLVGRTIEEAGLRHLPGLYLMEIQRDEQILVAVSPQERLQPNDRLVFVGVVESVVDLQKIRGLRPATNQVFKLDSPRPQRCLIEAVVSNSCPLVGQTIRDGRFRTVYNAVVIAVARSGERIRKKVGDIVLQPGDTLLLEAHPSFVEQHRNSRDFFLVSPVPGSSLPRYEKAGVAVAILSGMVLMTTVIGMDVLKAAMLAAGLMILTRCLSGSAARQSVDWRVLLAIAASLGIGRALEKSGLAKVVAETLLQWGGSNPYLALAILYGVTMLITELVTNNAAAVLMFPIALSAAQSLGVNFTPFAIAVMIAASAGFASPIGYQTHLMVYGLGSYLFSDFLRVGIPLDLLLWGVTVLVTPFVWPFYR